jgi:hypothetical protein
MEIPQIRGVVHTAEHEGENAIIPDVGFLLHPAARRQDEPDSRLSCELQRGAGDVRR